MQSLKKIQAWAQMKLLLYILNEEIKLFIMHLVSHFTFKGYMLKITMLNK